MTSKEDYDKGFQDGLTAFAWWKDGVEYVGSCGMTLEEALAERETIFTYSQHKDESQILEESRRIFRGTIW